MKRSEVLAIYDQEYAQSYNDNYLLGENFIECTRYELSRVGELLENADSWLDIGCGTGYLLSQFPAIDRCGLDLSPAMLDVARKDNPDVSFVEGDFRVDAPNWRNSWDLVSCTWYAYCYVDSVEEIEQVIRNIALWTAPDGSCFFPVCDPDVLCKAAIPHKPPADSDDGRLEITAIVWNWTDEPSKKRHRNLIAPHPDYLVFLFKKFFQDVHVLNYPKFRKDCMASRKAIIARKRLGCHGLTYIK